MGQRRGGSRLRLLRNKNGADALSLLSLAFTQDLLTMCVREDAAAVRPRERKLTCFSISSLHHSSVHHRVFLSHRFGIASDDLDELNKMIEMLSPPRKWHDWHLLVRVGAPVEDNKEAQRHLELIQLYYESMSTLPHFKRGGHPGGEDGVDAAPWGVRWEEDRKKTRLLFKEQRGGESVPVIHLRKG